MSREVLVSRSPIPRICEIEGRKIPTMWYPFAGIEVLDDQRGYIRIPTRVAGSVLVGRDNREVSVSYVILCYTSTSPKFK